MWNIIRELVAVGTTLLLTTQYMDEADELADNIVVIDHGLVIASGTSEELKDRIGGDVVEFSVTDRSRFQVAVDAVSSLGDGSPLTEPAEGRVQVHAGGQGSQVLVEVVRRLDAAGVQTTGLALRRPSLDDVFMALTGHVAEEIGAGDGARRPGPAGQPGRRLRRSALMSDEGTPVGTGDGALWVRATGLLGRSAWRSWHPWWTPPIIWRPRAWPKGRAGYSRTRG